jgi:hypothetical protein
MVKAVAVTKRDRAEMEEFINRAMGFFSRVATPSGCKSLMDND